MPKYIALELQAASSTTVPPGSAGVVTQLVKLTNSLHGQKPLLLKLKVDYVGGGGPVSDLVDVTLNV